MSEIDLRQEQLSSLFSNDQSRLVLIHHKQQTRKFVVYNN